MAVELNQLWVYLASTPLFHLTLTVVSFVLATQVFERSGENPLFNPVLGSIALIICVLNLTDTDYWAYLDGAKFVHFLLGPATVALAVPLYGQWAQLKKSWAGIVISLLLGSLTAIISAVAIAWLLGASLETLLSIAPKSVTTPVAMGITEKMGGITSLTAVLVICAGIFGATCGSIILSVAKVQDKAAIGLALGVASHGIGTARAFQIGKIEGAYAGMGMALNALLTSLLIPLFAYLLG